MSRSNCFTSPSQFSNFSANPSLVTYFIQLGGDLFEFALELELALIFEEFEEEGETLVDPDAVEDAAEAHEER